MINRKAIPVIFIAMLLIAIAVWVVFFSGNGGVISLQWNANSEADLAGYKIYYGISPGNYTRSIVVTPADDLRSGKVTYQLTGLVKGQVYFIAVTAFDKSGKESGYSEEVAGLAR